ncbi:hypothetical protein [Mastigocladopsis repens]|uniref:hypothetical protein n=1 Tax=Mastigocladopsis repens TaxID=221287 RepID=UPI00037C7213|nr:hypothetical protein [Mastigocladopsis repens]
MSMRTQHRTSWTIGTLGAAILLPSIISKLLGIYGFFPFVLLIFPYLPILANTVTTVWLLLGQVLVLVLLNLQLTRQLRRAGESTSKVLFAPAK